MKKSFGFLSGQNHKKLKQKLMTLNSTNNITLNKEVESEKQKLLDDYKNHLHKNKQSMVEETKSHTLLMSSAEQTTTANE